MSITQTSAKIKWKKIRITMVNTKQPILPKCCGNQIVNQMFEDDED